VSPSSLSGVHRSGATPGLISDVQCARSVRNGERRSGAPCADDEVPESLSTGRTERRLWRCHSGAQGERDVRASITRFNRSYIERDERHDVLESGQAGF